MGLWEALKILDHLDLAKNFFLHVYLTFSFFLLGLLSVTFLPERARGMIYRYNSPVGSFTIRPAGSGQFELHINTTFVASYRSPEAAALDVSLHATGWKEWDLFPGCNGPQNLFEWEVWRIRRSSNWEE